MHINNLKKTIIMKVGTAWANKAYNETRRSGGDKESARVASRDARERYIEHIKSEQRRFSGGEYDEDVSDESHYINEGSWHTGSDL